MFDRASMAAEITKRGWRSEVMFGAQGPVLFIYGDFPGHIAMPVPVRLDDDHRPAMDGVYTLYSGIQEMKGFRGTA